MKNGRIILKAQLTNLSPIGIGSGRDEHSDRDIVTTIYDLDNSGNILPPESFPEFGEKIELPFIPATSFLGKIFRLFDLEKYPEIIKRYWGESEQNASFIDCSDILLTELPKNEIEIRDGIRLDSAKGTVAKGAKFDYELLAPGAKFDLTILFRVENEIDYVLATQIACDIASIIETGFDLGAKTTVGYGKMKGDNVNLYELDFDDEIHFEQWIKNNLTQFPISKTAVSLLKSDEQLFEIKASFSIKNSLIIRSYSKDPKAVDSTHLKSGGINILAGSSIKGALRGRAERILNTIHRDAFITETVLAGLFGDVEKEEADKQKVKKDGYTVPSRVFVDEVPIEEVKEEIQTRIQIDRFTGGTVDGALIEEVPLFPIKDKEQIKNFRISIKEAQPADKGLMLLLLKDLWTGDLPIGGEKSIGRGVLKGVKSELKDGKETYMFDDDFTNPLKMKKLQGYVDSLNNLDNYEFYFELVKTYKDCKK